MVKYVQTSRDVLAIQISNLYTIHVWDYRSVFKLP